MSALDPIPEQPEGVPGRPAGAALGVAVLVIATCAVIVWALQAFQLAGGGRSAIERIDLRPPAEPLSAPTAVEGRRARERQDLDRWSWADRSRRRVRVPIDVAIDRYLEHRLEQRGDR